MHRIVSVIFVLVLAAGAWAQGPGQGGDPGKPEDPCKKALDEFAKGYKEGNTKKDPQARITALHLLDPFLTAGAADQRAVDAISKVLNTASETDAVKIAAAQQLGGTGNVKLLSTFEKAFSANEKNDCAQEMVNQMGRIQDKTAVKSLEKIIRPRVTKFEDAKAGLIARSGINALATLRFFETAEALMKLMDTVQTGKPRKDETVPPENQAKEAERTQNEAAIKGAMTALTAQNLAEYDDWKKWWQVNKKIWKPQ